MIEIFETCQTKSIAKQTNRDESLIIRSIRQGYQKKCQHAKGLRFHRTTMEILFKIIEKNPEH